MRCSAKEPRVNGVPVLEFEARKAIAQSKCVRGAGSRRCSQVDRARGGDRVAGAAGKLCVSCFVWCECVVLDLKLSDLVC